MAIFNNKNDNLIQIKEIPIKLEKDLQNVTEINLETIFGLDFVSTEFSLHNFRIDTLAFNKETNSFVIIEYKKDRSFSVVDQGYSYLALMLNNKADFILEYNENTKQHLRRNDVDWSQSKVLFLANSFTVYQQNAINFKDLPIELWEVKKFDNQTILYNRLKSEEARESIKTISKNKTIQNVDREIKTYSVDNFFQNNWSESRNIFEEFKERVISLDSRINEVPTKGYIGYKIDNHVMIAVTPRKSKIRIEVYRILPKDINDPQKVLKYQNKSMERYNKHVSEFFIKNSTDIDYAMFLIKQIYEKFYK